MKILNNGLTPKQNLIGLGVLAILLFCLYVWVSQPTANASTDVRTLQESVEQAQADYDLSQKQAKDALVQYCTNWKALAQNKANLADAMKITTNINREAVMAVDCTQLTLPSTF